MNLRSRPLVVVGVIVAALGNAVLNYLDHILNLPLFFDSFFTAIGAAVYGWVPGLAIAILSQVAIQASLVVAENMVWGMALPFVLCQIETALVIGLMVRFGSFRSIPSLIVAVFAVALGNSVIGSLVATFVFGGITLHGADFLVAGLIMGGQNLLEASFWARVPINLVDKGIAVVAAYLLLQRWGTATWLPIKIPSIERSSSSDSQ